MSAPDELLSLAHWFGAPENDQCILAEGNVSCLGEDGLMWIKASGQQMANMSSGGLVEVSTKPLLEALDNPAKDEAQVRQILNDARTDAVAVHVPSTEAFMHALLLELPDVRFVGHSHPTALLSVLALENALEYSGNRLFPDEIVCCGPAACFVRYTAPGLPLANKIKTNLQTYIQRWEIAPRTIWLQNHGLICLGETPEQVKSAAAMSVKAARVLLGALQSKVPIRWMTNAEVRQIYQWPDEHYRQKLLSGL